MEPRKPSSAAARVVVFYLCCACFFLQTGFVYLNYPRDGVGPKLSQAGKHGLEIWRRNNCQACHQIYGYGGFLGPDLTNIMVRRPYEDWTDILTRGRKQMPAFELDEDECEAIVAFLTETSSTGIGVPSFTKLKEGIDANTLVAKYVEETKIEIDDAVLRGERQIRENACNMCHRPFAVGRAGSPDLTLALSVRSAEYCRDAVLNSRGSMPAYDFLTPGQIDDIMACLSWMNRNRRELGVFYSVGENGNVFNWAAVPWFEY